MKEVVVLVHGLMNNSIIMTFLSRALKKAGYAVYSFDYSTRKYSDETLNSLHELVLTLKEQKVYLIGHSMGGLVIRNYITCAHYDISMIKGVVTIATPHNQSASGHALSTSIFRSLLGTAGTSGLTIEIPAWNSNIPIGCIAGESTSRWTQNFFLTRNRKDESNDGTVFVNEAILSNCNDSIVLKGSHTGLLFKKSVAEQCIHFVKFGKFD